MPRATQEEITELRRRLGNAYTAALGVLNFFSGHRVPADTQNSLNRLRAHKDESSSTHTLLGARPTASKVATAIDLLALGETKEALCASFGLIMTIPLPAFFRVRKDKSWVLTKEPFPRGSGRSAGSWGRVDEETLQLHLATARNLKPGSADRNTADENIHSLREQRRIACANHIRVVLSRGPCEEETTVKEDARMRVYPAIKKLYYSLRRRISHMRIESRQAKHSNGRFGQRRIIRHGSVAGVYEIPGSVLYQYKARSKRGVFKEKRPETYTRHVGIELEFAARSTREELSLALYEAGLLKQVTLKDDGSVRISKTGDKTHELCILAPADTVHETIKQACATLRSAGGYVNRSCGMHVHLDMRRKRPEVCFQRLLASLNILYMLVPEERRYNRFCRRNVPSQAWPGRGRPTDSSDNRYLAINPYAYGRHKTIEVRLHGGTLNPLKINHWIDLLTTIVNTPNTIRYKNLDRFIQDLKIPEGLAEYMRSRVKLFDADDVDTDTEHLPTLEEDSEPGPTTKCDCYECSYVPHYMDTGALRDADGSASRLTNDYDSEDGDNEDVA